MSEKYILDGKTPVPINDLMTWANWFESANRAVAKDEIGGVRISTVFLGIDHRFHDWEAGPLLFETMIFGGPRDQEMWRCCTWDEAEQQHAHALEVVRTHPEQPAADRSVIPAQAHKEER